ncbi:MAG: hypothetical protein PUI21_03805 [Collinsella sp.]|nr:hypothetical protein [Collinsella sp.]
MASVQHLPFNPTADTIELADGSRWVREKTCHVVEFARCSWRKRGIVRRIVEYRCSRCGAEPWADRDSVTRYCPNCGARVVDEEQDASEPI